MRMIEYHHKYKIIYRTHLHAVLHSDSTIIYETIQILTLSEISLLAPDASKNWTTFVCPLTEANISAVLPFCRDNRETLNDTIFSTSYYKQVPNLVL